MRYGVVASMNHASAPKMRRIRDVSSLHAACHAMKQTNRVRPNASARQHICIFYVLTIYIMFAVVVGW